MKLNVDELQQKSVWYIATVFYLFGGLIAPVLTGYFWEQVGYVAIEYIDRPLSVGLFGVLVTYFVITWTVMKVAVYAEKRYQQVDANKVAIIATGFYSLITATWILFTWYTWLVEVGIDGGVFQFLILFKVLIMAFYGYVLFTSIKRYYSNYMEKPLYVKIGLFAVPTRKTAKVYMYLCAATAFVSLVAGLMISDKYLPGVLLLLAAFWYKVSIKWMDDNGGWRDQTNRTE